MRFLPERHHWRAEGLRLRRLPAAWLALGLLFLALLGAALAAGLEARAWRNAAAAEDAAHAAALADATAAFCRAADPAPSRAIATYQLGRGALGATRMPVTAGLVLGVSNLRHLPTRVRASLDSRHTEAGDTDRLRNPLLTDSGLPGLPAVVALLLPLVALTLCAGLLQEEREAGRLGLLRVQAGSGLWPVLLAALGWRLLALWGVAAAASLPALALDPGADGRVALAWLGALAAFSAVWVALGGLLSCVPVSAATALLASLGLWLASTFAVPAVLAALAGARAPVPSRLAAVVEIRAAQQHAEDHEAALAAAWYAAHPGLAAAGAAPAAWPASFLPRVLEQDRRLQPMAARFADSRARQAAFVGRWSWLSPGLALVLWGQRQAGTDAAGHAAYLDAVAAFEQQWRAVLVPRVMSRRGLACAEVGALDLPGKARPGG